MGDGNAPSTRVGDHPPIPTEGLAVVLASWSGRGSLFEALSVPSDEREVRQWNAQDVRKRANRVLLAMLEPALLQWPNRVNYWLDYLPATKSGSRVVKAFPFPGVAWAQSRRSFGWPPTAFVGKESQRGADMLAVQVLRWCAEQMAQVWSDCISASPDMSCSASEQISVAVQLLGHEPLASATAMLPTRSDLTALSREGSPWGSVAKVAHLLVEAQRSQDFLLHELLMPDDEIRWRLFHLATFGVILASLRDAGCTLLALRPLSAGSGKPNYQVTLPSGAQCELWFEASGVWGHTGRTSPFVEATQAVGRARRSNGADILLLRGHRDALIIECKYSANPDVVARNGYYQAMAYATEARSRLASSVVAVAVGPEGVVDGVTFTSVEVGRIGTAAPSALRELVSTFVGATH
jgi:hypothetical protein